MEYLLKASAVIAIFYICYKLFLQRDTFFETNRSFLLAGLITAFTIPFIVIPIYVEYTPVLLDTIVFDNTPLVNEKTENPFTLLQLLTAIYLLGFAFFFIRFMIQLMSLFKVIISNEGEKNDSYTFIKTTNKISPFSFFNWIVYNPDLFSKIELDQIITHEKVHARQHHSIDILLTQLSCIILWFNPLIWFYNKDLKQNLEFIADKNAQNKSDCKKSYQYTLLKTSMPTHQLALTNNFYNSLIKKRIVMLHKSKSKKINKLKYAIVIPILTVFLMSFSTKEIYIEKELPISENSFINNSFIKDALPINNDIINKDKPTNTSNVKKPIVLNTKPQKKAIKIISKNDVVIITKNFTDADFKKITNDLKEKGITIKFKGIKRNKNNEIIAIKINASSKNSNANYSLNSDEAIKPIKISFDDDNSISIGNGKAKHVHGANAYVIKSKNGKHKIHKSGKGNNVFVFSNDDEDYEIIHEDGDSIHFKNHGKKGKYAVVRNHSNVEIISDDDHNENVEIVIENDDTNEDEDVIILKSANAKSNYKVKTIGKGKNSSKFLFSVDDDNKKPLYILDGKEIKKDKFEDIIDNDNIKRIKVYIGDDATKKYGDKAKDGVIEITTKKKD